MTAEGVQEVGDWRGSTSWKLLEMICRKASWVGSTTGDGTVDPFIHTHAYWAISWDSSRDTRDPVCFSFNRT